MKTKKDLACALAVFTVPFLYLFRYVVADMPYSRFIGNDFTYLYYNFKLYLLSSLSQSRIPLWSPSEGCGFPFYSNPFTQTFYPLNIPLLVYEKLTGGYSSLDHQRFTVLGISLFGVGLYLWLRSMRIPARNALFAAMIISVSYKTTELVRFPNAIHTAAWIPFILWGCTLATKKGNGLRSGAVISASTLMMLTGGYFYYVYYSAFIIAPFVTVLLIPKTRRAFMNGETAALDTRGFLRTLLLSFAASVAVCAPYLAKVSRLLSQTTDRGGENFAYSTAHEFTILDNIGSLIFPPAAQTEGWYYFGFVGLIIILFYCIRTLIEKSRKRDLVFLCGTLAWIAVIVYITHGKHSYLFKLLWEYLPGFSALRVWGRMNIILLPLIALLLARACGSFERYISRIGGRENGHTENGNTEHGNTEHGNTENRHGPAVLLLAGTYLAILLTQVFLYRRGELADYYWLHYIRPFLGAGFDEIVFIYSGIASFMLVAVVLTVARRRDMRSERVLFALWASFALVNILDVGVVGAKQWSINGRIDTAKHRLDVRAINFESLSLSRVYDHSTVKFGPRFSAGYIVNWHYARFVDFLREYGDSPIANMDLKQKPGDFKRLLALEGSRRLYFSKAIDYSSIGEFLSDADRHSAVSELDMVVEEYDGDYLRVTVEARREGYLSFIDNWDQDWKATVGGDRVEIERLFGTFKAVALKAGRVTVEFAYRPLG